MLSAPSDGLCCASSAFIWLGRVIGARRCAPAAPAVAGATCALNTAVTISGAPILPSFGLGAQEPRPGLSDDLWRVNLAFVWLGRRVTISGAQTGLSFGLKTQ